MSTTIQAKKINGKVVIASSQSQLANKTGTQANSTAGLKFPVKPREFANKEELTAYMKKRGATQAEINTAIANFGL